MSPGRPGPKSPRRMAASAAAVAIALLAWLGLALAEPPAEKNLPSTATAKAAPSPSSSEPQYTTESLRGRVMFFGEALKGLYDIGLVPEAAERTLVLKTPTGELHPLVEDVRGRAFRVDQRLRNVDMELLVRRYRGSPFVQVIRVYALRPDGKYEVDYWCEICAIAMFELKPCDCCQGDIELRFRKTEE